MRRPRPYGESWTVSRTTRNRQEHTMYHTDFTREIARQHQAELVREAHAYSARRRYQRKVKETRRRNFTWVTVAGWQLSH
jgi:hypothetical protein